MATTLLEAPEPVGPVDVFNGVDNGADGTLPSESADTREAAAAAADGSITAYYSLAFPNFTYYLQTLSVTIGRRLAAQGSADDDDLPPVDVDLGPVKSVSRLHAKITYDDEDGLWVLEIYGRNGAWVDGHWFGAGNRVPLQSKSLIQIASRSFHFILPTADGQDDSLPASSPTSTTRPRSPSLDATSLSPASSLHSITSPTPPDPEHIPEPEIVQLPKPKLVRKRAPSDVTDSSATEHPQLVKPAHAPVTPEPPPVPPPVASKPKASSSKVKSAKTSALPKAVPPVKQAPEPTPEPVPVPATAPIELELDHATASPEPTPVAGPSEPPKPNATLSVLCYRAIGALGGRATLQGILGWIMDTYEWYRLHEGEKWESSVRHNLSSNTGFVKSARTSAEKGKGAFWCIHPDHIATFEEAEARFAANNRSSKPKTASKTPAVSAATPVMKVKKEPASSAIPSPSLVHARPAEQTHPKPPVPLPPPKPALFTNRPLTKPALASPFTSRPLYKPPGPPGMPMMPLPPGMVPHLPPGVVPFSGMTLMPGARPATTSTPSAPPTVTPAVPAVPPVVKAALPRPTAASTDTPQPVAGTASPSSSASTSAVVAAPPPPDKIPIVVGALPPSFVVPEGGQPPLIALHEGKLFLSPLSFSHLTPPEIADLENMGAQKALAALQPQVVKFLKEQMRLRGRGRGRARGRGAPPGRGGPPGRGRAPSAGGELPKQLDQDTEMHDETTPAVASAPDASRSLSRPRSNSAQNNVPLAKRPRVETVVEAA